MMASLGRAFCFVTLLAGAACQPVEGTSFDVELKPNGPSRPFPTVALGDIRLSPEQTIFVISRSGGGTPFATGFIACDFGAETKIKFGSKINPRLPCKGKKEIVPRPRFGSFKTTLSSGREVYFILEKVNKRQTKLVPLFRTRGGDLLSLQPKSYVSLSAVNSAVNVVGDPFDPANDPDVLAETLKREIPGLGGLRVVPLQKTRVECRERVLEGVPILAPSSTGAVCEIL